MPQQSSPLGSHTTTNGASVSRLEVYRDQTLGPIVKPWLLRGDNFVLEEDNYSGHGGGASKKSNIVQTRKTQTGLKQYFN